MSSAPHEIPLSRPDITSAEIDLVTQVLRSGRLSLGPMQERFEELVAAKSDRRFAVAVSSGTCGLHLALQALGVGPGDEVITTPLSFIASSNCILFVGARPVFVDVCPKTLNMNPALLEKAITPRTKAILAVEAYGNPAYMPEYESIAARHEIPLVEDCCEALGCSIRGRMAGSFGRISVFGFYPNKQITTGEGGMIVTDDKRIADLCRSMRSQGRGVPGLDTPSHSRDDTAGRPGMGGGSGGAIGGMGPTGAGAASGGAFGSWLHHERLGYNYRLDEMSSALGVAQMRRLEEIIRLRQGVVRGYMRRLMDHREIILPTIEPETVMSWFVFVVRLASAYTREERDSIIDALRRHDIGAADYFPCIHLQPFYRTKFGHQPGEFPIAESISQRTIALPLFNHMTEAQVDLVVQTLELMLERQSLARRH